MIVLPTHEPCGDNAVGQFMPGSVTVAKCIGVRSFSKCNCPMSRRKSPCREFVKQFDDTEKCALCKLTEDMHCMKCRGTGYATADSHGCGKLSKLCRACGNRGIWDDSKQCNECGAESAGAIAVEDRSCKCVVDSTFVHAGEVREATEQKQEKKEEKKRRQTAKKKRKADDKTMDLWNR